MYNFDKTTERRNTDSYKWDVKEGELPMWIADMDFETVPEAKAELQKTAERGIFGYSSVPCEFFESIADFLYERNGFRPDTEWMIYSNGVVAAISSMVRKLTTPAENVLIQAPVYNIFYNSILNNGRRVLSSDLVYDNGEYRIDFEDLEEKLSDPQTTLMILCNPHNPIGKIWNRETLVKIAELCRKHGVRVISDEIHGGITAPGKSYIPFASVSPDAADISVTLVSASKSFNMAGLQSAAAIIKNPELRHKVWRGLNTDEVGEPNVFAMRANIAAFRHGGAWLDELCEYLFENRRYCEEFIKKNMPHLHTVSADATYLLWVDISYYSTDSVDFTEKLRERTGLYVSDGTEYGECASGFIRINLATQRYNVEDGMSRLLKYITEIEAENEKN